MKYTTEDGRVGHRVPDAYAGHVHDARESSHISQYHDR